MRALAATRRTIESAWQAFLGDGRVAACVRPEIRRSWERARAARVEPGLTAPPTVLAPDDLRARVEAEETLRAAAPLVAEFASRLAGDGHVVAYFDGEGTMLALDGNRRSRGLLEDVNFAPGACWSERAAGTNGPGTALAEARPVEVFASEHFVTAWQPWTCASAPVRVAGVVVAAVDITSPWQRHERGLLAMAEALARAVEARLDATISRRATAELAAIAQDAIGLRDRFLADASHELRTPLTPLRLKLQALRRRAERAGAPMAADDLARALRGTEQDFRRVLDALDTLLGVSRP